MVAAVQSGQSQRAVARQFGVSLATVQLWVKRAQAPPPATVDWEGGSHAPHHQPRQTSATMIGRVLEVRQQLRVHSDLGEYGARAIRAHLLAQPDLSAEQVPAEATINRLLRQHGLFDARRRVRRPAPVPGWYLPEVAAEHADIDETDWVEGLYLEGGPEIFALNLVSLHGGLCETWLHPSMRAATVRECLISHWRAFGRPAYAQFDNGNMFAGPRQHPDAVGQVIWLCLSLQVTPVFAVPCEFGVQSAIESYNNQWQQKVWRRWHFDTFEGAHWRSDRYVAAVRGKRGARQAAAPPRRPFPADWSAAAPAPRSGQIIFLRRTSEHGQVHLLGRDYLVDEHWCHRLVRCEVDLRDEQVRVFGLRRAEPDVQPLLREWPYRLPLKTGKRLRAVE